jgi:F0F1-type ATP synthase epsilon subunit
MVHIDTAKAEGTSKTSLTKAISAAIADILGGYKDVQKISITIIIDGYEFNGEEYVVKVRAIVANIDKDMEEAYHEKADDLEERLQAGDDMAHDFTESSDPALQDNYEELNNDEVNFLIGGVPAVSGTDVTIHAPEEVRAEVSQARLDASRDMTPSQTQHNEPGLGSNGSNTDKEAA